MMQHFREKCLRLKLMDTAQKMKFSIKGFSVNVDPQIPADLVKFTEEILYGKLHFLCSGTIFVERFHHICFAVL